MTEFLQNNWLTIGTLTLCIYLFPKSILLYRKHEDKTGAAGFILSGTLSVICLILCGCYVLVLRNQKPESLPFFLDMWTVILIVALASFIIGKFFTREAFIEPLKISQRELNERIKTKKKTMQTAVK